MGIEPIFPGCSPGVLSRLNYGTVREAARLQSFPDWFEFQGSETSAFTQIGNAVPPMLAYAIAGSIRATLESDKHLNAAQIKRRRQPSQMQLLAA